MRLRLIVTGALGLVLALVWAMAFFYQRHNVATLMAMVFADSPLALKVSSLWSVLQIWINALLIVPVLATGIGAMLGARPMVRVLRVAVVAGVVLNVGVLVINALLAFANGEAVLVANPRVYYEVLVALGTLGLQVVLLALCRQSLRNDSGGAVTSSSASEQREEPNKTLPPSNNEPKLAALPAR